ncbi:MAG: cytochrome c biogenesis protein CcdA, partial [Thermoanaerobaculia bacterium]
MRRLPLPWPAAAAFCILAAPALPVAAAVPAAGQLVQVEAITQAGTQPGRGRLTVTARIAQGWHVNSHTPSEDYLIPTSVVLDATPSVTAGDARYPDGLQKKFAFSDKPLSVYEERFTVEIPISFSGDSAPVLAGKLEFQACNDKQCLAPASVAFRSAAGPAAAGPAAALSGGAVSLADAPASGAAGASRDFGALLERRGLLAVLALLFFGGLALNLTPCVYPVIPLTVSFFGGQTHGDRRRSFALAAVYVLGMATMYSALGVAASLSGKLFGAALQSPWVLSGVA